MRASYLTPAVFLLAACGTDVSGPAASLFSCLLSDAARMDVGEVVQVAGAGNRGLCLEGGADGAEFVYIPFHAAAGEPVKASPLRLEISGAGLAAEVLGPPSPSPGAAAQRLPLSDPHAPPGLSENVPFHHRLRAEERGRMTERLRPAPAASVPFAVAAVPEIGDLVTYNVAVRCDGFDERTGRVEFVSDAAVLVADTENPSPLAAEDYRHFGLTFDTLVHPLGLEHFGEPTDVDGNGRAIIFFTRAVNELTPPSSSVYTVGFFWSGDLFPEEDTPRAEGCPGGNQAEIFYMLTPDPLGVVGPRFTAAFIRNSAIAIIAHEYQHLINAGRRLWVNEAGEFEEPWLNEGLSHVAEELVFYRAAGLTPGRNIGQDDLPDGSAASVAFELYMSGNFANYRRFLGRPDTVSLFGLDALPTRGAAWSFLRYAADRSGQADPAFFTALVNARTAGLENLGDVFGASALAWAQDWTVSVYADDALPVEERHQQPSWNFRDLYRRRLELQSFPLSVVPLEADMIHTVLLRQGGTAFPRFGVPPGQLAVVHTEAGGDAPPPSLKGSFLRTR